MDQRPNGWRELPIERWGRALVVHVQARADRTALGRLLFEFLMFGLKEAWACVFGAALLAMILLTHLFWPASAPLASYNALVIGAIALQAGMLVFRLEDLNEAAAILIFRGVGTGMEPFKTATGSWSYPERSLLRLAGVPLFSGFMYASAGS